LFEAQAERTADAVAVVYEQRQLSYREYEREGQQAGPLPAGLGVGPEQIVRYLLERTREDGSGDAWSIEGWRRLPWLDRGYPAERLSYMMRDAGVKVVLTEEEVKGELSTKELETVVSIDGDWEKIQHYSPLTSIKAPARRIPVT